MTIAPLRFAPFDEAASAPNVVVDGSANAGTVLVLSHWPGIPSPPDCAADSSAQMVFRYLDRGAGLHGDAEWVTNNHFDQDGLAGIYALTCPDDALRRRAIVEELASAGDFAVTTDRWAARVSMAVAALADPQRSPLGPLPDDADARCAAMYRSALALLPGWLDDPERCHALWEEEDGHRFSHRTFHGVHPIALHSVTDRTTLAVVDPDEGRHHVTCRYEGWVQYRSRRIRPRVDLRPLAEQLDALETGGATWTATPPGDLTPELHPRPDGPPSSLAAPELLAPLANHLRTSPPAWRPERMPAGWVAAAEVS